MWKKSYSIGVKAIDKQHIELFQMVEKLLKSIQNNAGREEFEQSIEFLKKYVLIHFRDEEAYQAYIQYSGLEEHKLLHREFTNSVMDYEKRLKENNYAVPIVKDLAGMLTTWLIYHVAQADQQIVGEKKQWEESELKSYLRSFTISVAEVLCKMSGIDRNKMSGDSVSEIGLEESIYVKVGLVGDKTGEAIFSFSKELTFNLVEAMTFMKVNQVDEMVCSVLAEISNISSGNAATYITKKGFVCDITTPNVYTEKPEEYCSVSGIHVNTGIGSLDVAVQIN